LFTALLFSTLTWSLAVQAVLISNVQPRLDTRGQIVNAHDGCIVQFPSNPTYYLYGTVYENCHQQAPTCDPSCGYFNNTFALYTSPDLIAWTLETTNVLPELSLDNSRVSYWMPNVFHNKQTGLYVMVYWSGHYGFVNNYVAVATSKSPLGPFVNQKPIALSGAKVISSTINFWVDDDTGIGYVRYNTRDAPLRHGIEQLTDDWLASTGKFSTMLVKQDFPWYEGGGVFKVDKTFYTMLGTDCCYCQWGADALLLATNNPLGNWTETTEMNNCADGKTPTITGIDGKINPCSVGNVQGTNFTVPAQQFNVITFNTKSGKQYMYYGERFRSSPDGIKSRDFQAWIPIHLNERKAIQPMQWVDSFHIDL